VPASDMGKGKGGAWTPNNTYILAAHSVVSSPVATYRTIMALRMQATYTRLCRAARSMSFVGAPLGSSADRLLSS
jgi:hypothetical protein